MDRQVTPPSRVTWPTWGPPPPCKQSLRFDQISPRSRKISQSSWRDLFYLAQMSFISARSRRDLISLSSQRDLVYLAEISFISPESRRDLVGISPEIAFISCRSQRHYKSRRVLVEISLISTRSLSSRRDLVANSEITNLAEISVKFLHGNCREFSQPLECLYIRICKQRKKVFYCFYKISFPEKKSKTLFFKILIKTQILTSREVLYTKLVRVISPYFSTKRLSKIRVFLA